MAQVSGITESQGVISTPTCSQFLDLPRELRDRIYRELLAPDIGCHQRVTYDLSPAILRVNKQIHDEAATVLYDEHCWVVINVQMLRYCLDFKSVMRTSTAPTIVLEACNRLFAGTSHITMNIDCSADSFNDCMVASVYDLQRILHTFERTYRVSSLEVHLVGPFTRYPQHRDRLITCCLELRNIVSAEIYNLQPATLGKCLAGKMETPAKSNDDEAIKKLRAYKLRGDQEAALSKFRDAAMSYEDGYKYSVWRRGDDELEVSRENDTFAKVEIAYNMTVAMAAEHGLCEIRMGDSMQALSILRTLPGRYVSGTLKANIFHYLGLAWLAQQNLSNAGNSFLDALAVQPDHLAARHEVENLISTMEGNPEIGDQAMLTMFKVDLDLETQKH